MAARIFAVLAALLLVVGQVAAAPVAQPKGPSLNRGGVPIPAPIDKSLLKRV